MAGAPESGGTRWSRASARDDPSSWSIPLPPLGRIHVSFVVYGLIELARPIGGPLLTEKTSIAIDRALLYLAALFVVVIISELGRSAIRRRVGDAPGEIILWPLGGLDPVRKREPWQAAFLAHAGGPLTLAALFVPLAVALGSITGNWWGVAVPTPFSEPALGALSVDGRQPWWLFTLYAAQRMTFVVLLISLLPMHPLPGLGLVSALAERRGRAGSNRFIFGFAITTAVLVGLTGVLSGAWALVALATVSVLGCVLEARRREWTQREIEDGPLELSELEEGPPMFVPSQTQPAAASAVDRDAPGAEVDRVLAKIAAEGMGALTDAEKSLLARATERARGGHR